MLTYEKPKDVTYTQMAIWIDNNVYSGSFDVEKCYIYLYLLCLMLASRLGFFVTEEETDSFALYSATRLYNRLTNTKQFETNPDGTPKMQKITSILNFTKNVLGGYKYDYDLEFKGMPQTKDVEVINVPYFAFDTYVAENTYIYDQLDSSFTFQGLSSTVKRHLSKIPRKKHSAEWDNIYLSCLLTLLNTVTLSEEQKKRLKNATHYKHLILDKLYKELRFEDPILYHLDSSYKNYILTLVNEIRDVLAAEITWTSNTHITSDTSIENLLLCAYGGDLDEC